MKLNTPREHSLVATFFSCTTETTVFGNTSSYNLKLYPNTVISKVTLLLLIICPNIGIVDEKIKFNILQWGQTKMLIYLGASITTALQLFIFLNAMFRCQTLQAALCAIAYDVLQFLLVCKRTCSILNQEGIRTPAVSTRRQLLYFFTASSSKWIRK